MDYKEKLKHYAEDDGVQDDNLLDEAIATLENYFGYLDEDQLIHHNRVDAIAYLALKHSKDIENEKNYWKECYNIALGHLREIEDNYFIEHGTNFNFKEKTTNQ